MLQEDTIYLDHDGKAYCRGTTCSGHLTLAELGGLLAVDPREPGVGGAIWAVGPLVCECGALAWTPQAVRERWEVPKHPLARGARLCTRCAGEFTPQEAHDVYCSAHCALRAIGEHCAPRCATCDTEAQRAHEAVAELHALATQAQEVGRG